MPWGPRGGVEAEIYSFFNLGARWEWVVNATPRPLYPHPERGPLPIVQEAGWAPGPVCTREENLAPHRVSIPGPSSVPISTELSQLTFWVRQRIISGWCPDCGRTYRLLALHQTATLCGVDVQRDFCKKIVGDAEIRIWTKDFQSHITGMGPKKQLCIRYACWVFLLRLCSPDERTCSSVSVVLVSEGLRCLRWASKCLHFW
jgi:hypothetical protein